MTEEELINTPVNGTQQPRVSVSGGDYHYRGWLVSKFRKRKSSEWRLVVEDSHGRLFIHNAKQIELVK